MIASKSVQYIDHLPLKTFQHYVHETTQNSSHTFKDVKQIGSHPFFFFMNTGLEDYRQCNNTAHLLQITKCI